MVRDGEPKDAGARAKPPRRARARNPDRRVTREPPAARASWPVKKTRLGDEDEPAAPPGASPSERVAMVWTLTLDAWAMTGQPLPDYARADAPGLVRPTPENAARAYASRSGAATSTRRSCASRA